MTTRKTLAPGLLALALGAAALAAWAGDDCDVPTQRWQSRDAVRQMAAHKGWTLERLKIDDGCYEIRGRDAEGRRFKAKLDPETLEPVSMKRGGPERDREREHRRQRTPDNPAASPGAGPASPIFTPGSQPRAQVE